MNNKTVNAAQAIVDNVGGPENIVQLTHCATRLRFALGDSSKVDAQALDSIPGVLGVVPQSGNQYQVVMGGGVASAYKNIKALPCMSNAGKGRATTASSRNGKSDAEVKDAQRSKMRGKFTWLDAFFEYLSDSFRPIMGVLLGASLIIACASILDALHIVDFNSPDKSASWVFVDAMWNAVFYFLPIMVAYNASKKLGVDAWLGATIMGALMTPQFMSLAAKVYVPSGNGDGMFKEVQKFADVVCTTNPHLNKEFCTIDIFGIPMQLNNYGGQVFVPLIMVAVLALVYRGLTKIFPENVQMVFVPFFSMIIMIPVTAFLIGPLGVWLGNGLGDGLAWLNGNAPFIFAILIPMLYPFLVPLGLHWPLNALMLMNINTLGYDFIQGPMGVWNFACFGATAGVLVIAFRNKNNVMRQTAIGALFAGLLGGISEPSLYGIHLRYKRIYPRMLVGCFVGGVVIAILSYPFGGVKTGAFAFTSLLTVPVFNPMWVYSVSIAVAFITSMVLIIISDYRTPEQREEEALAYAAANENKAAVERSEERRVSVSTGSSHAGADAATASTASTATAAPAPTSDSSTDIVTILAPLPGQMVSLDDVNDQVFASRALGEGVGIRPESGYVVAPISGKVVTVAQAGHAYGIKTVDGIEVLVHVGIDTVQLHGEHFSVKVSKGQEVVAGDLLAEADLPEIEAAGYDTTTIVVITNTAALTSVTPEPMGHVFAGDPILDVIR